jgi:preprotein translocase subunit SecY
MFMWRGEQITERGIGNGVSDFAGIVAGLGVQCSTPSAANSGDMSGSRSSSSPSSGFTWFVVLRARLAASP